MTKNEEQVEEEKVHRWVWTGVCPSNNIRCKIQPLTVKRVGVHLNKDGKRAGRKEEHQHVVLIVFRLLTFHIRKIKTTSKKYYPTALFIAKYTELQWEGSQLSGPSDWQGFGLTMTPKRVQVHPGGHTFWIQNLYSVASRVWGGMGSILIFSPG